MPEIELKFGFPATHRAEVAADLDKRGSPEAVPMHAAYFDTPDGRLAKAQMSLRQRREGDRWEQTVKAPDRKGSGTLHRLEHEVQLPHCGGQGSCGPPDVSLHHDTDVATPLRRALGSAQGKDLVLRFRTEVLRHRRTARKDGAQVEIAIDTGEIVVGDRRQQINEIEFELKSGEAAGMFDEARRWVRRHGLWIEGRSKAERGQWLSCGEEGAPPHKAGDGDWDPVDHVNGEVDLLRTLVRAVLAQVIANASEVAAGRETPGHVHQLRVGLRRLRTVLRVFGKAAPELAALEDSLASVFRALGAWRDQGVVRESIAPRLRRAGAPAVDLPHIPKGKMSPTAVVRGRDFQLALLSVLQFSMRSSSAATDQPDHSVGKKALDAVIAKRLSKLHRQIKRDSKRFDTLSEEAQHRVRKRLKRLRYLAELVAPRFKRHAVKRYLAALEPAQDSLGAHNDTVVAIQHYRELASSDPQAWFAVGWLTAHLRESEAASRQALKAIQGSKKFW